MHPRGSKADFLSVERAPAPPKNDTTAVGYKPVEHTARIRCPTPHCPPALYCAVLLRGDSDAGADRRKSAGGGAHTTTSTSPPWGARADAGASAIDWQQLLDAPSDDNLRRWSVGTSPTQ